MKNNIIRIVLWVVVVVVGYYGLTYKSPNQKEGTTTQDMTENKTAFSEFLERKEMSKCTVTKNIEGVETTGTILTFNGMLRGEFSTEVSGKKNKTEFLTRDNFYYTWTSATPGMGFKVRIVSTQVANADLAVTAAGGIGFNPDTVGEYSCEPWLVDQTKFILPLGVTFKDVTP